LLFAKLAPDAEAIATSPIAAANAVSPRKPVVYISTGLGLRNRHSATATRMTKLDCNLSRYPHVQNLLPFISVRIGVSPAFGIN